MSKAENDIHVAPFVASRFRNCSSSYYSLLLHRQLSPLLSPFFLSTILYFVLNILLNSEQVRNLNNTLSIRPALLIAINARGNKTNLGIEKGSFSTLVHINR